MLGFDHKCANRTNAYWLAVDSGSNCTGVVAALSHHRRITVTGGWMGRDRTDIIYSEIVKNVFLAVAFLGRYGVNAQR